MLHQSRESSPEQGSPACWTMCAVERETAGKGYRLEGIVTLCFRNADFLSAILPLLWLFSILIN